MNPLHRQHWSFDLVEDVDHLADRRWRRVDHVVAEDDGERLVADQRPGDEHRVTEAERLPGGCNGEVDQVETLGISASNSFLLRASRNVSSSTETSKWSSIGVLAVTGDQDDVVDACGDRFDTVLNDRLVDERQHLFRLCLGRRAGTRRQGRQPEHGLAKSSASHAHLLQSRAATIDIGWSDD